MGDTDGGQAGMLKPETRIAAQQGIIRKEESQDNLGIRRAPGSSSCHVSGARPSQKETPPGSKCIVPAASCLRLGPEIPVD